MGQDSKIEWTHHTFNPWWGCHKVSPACKFCYAETWARRVGIDAWGHRTERRFFTDNHWNEPLKWNRAAPDLAPGHAHRPRVFCASMADVFEDRRDLDLSRTRLWSLIEKTPRLDWLLLSKRPEHIGDLVPWVNDWPPNVWLGTTAENQHWADLRLPQLMRYRVSVRFASCEPLLGPINLAPYLAPRATGAGLNWVIAGGESGAKSRAMNPSWAKAIRDQCAQAAVPFHFKQWGHWGPESSEKKKGETRIVRDQDGTQIKLFKLGKRSTGRALEGQFHDGFPALTHD